METGVRRRMCCRDLIAEPDTAALMLQNATVLQNLTSLQHTVLLQNHSHEIRHSLKVRYSYMTTATKPRENSHWIKSYL